VLTACESPRDVAQHGRAGEIDVDVIESNERGDGH
jgi:hypothetical protein